MEVLKARAIIFNGEALAFFIFRKEEYMDHKYYFQSLDQLGRDAVVELRQLDEKQAPMHREYLEQRIKGEITELGYKNLVKTLDEARQGVVTKYKTKISELKEEYYKAEEKHMTPSAGFMHPEDMEVLKNFKLTVDEFNSFAEKYSDNPTMGRLLEDYRKEHAIETSWRFQGIDKRKEIFSNACSCVESIMGQLDKYSPDREGNVTRRVFGGYHKLQGSDPDALPIPPEENQGGIIDSMQSSGRSFF